MKIIKIIKNLKAFFNIKAKIPKDLFLDEMADILLLNVAIPWDESSSILNKDKVNQYKQNQFHEEKENDELNYWHMSGATDSFSDSTSDDIEKAFMNFQGFSLTYKVKSNSYYLSLHLGTRNEFRMRIFRALNENFDNVKIEDGNYVKGFTFDKKVEEILKNSQ